MPVRRATFLDANAGALLRPEAVEALGALIQSGPEQAAALPNPSSVHAPGREARRLIAEARSRVAGSLGSCRPEEITFTSSGTEANQWVIRSALEPWIAKGEKPHWILTRVEHESTLRMVPWLESQGGAVEWLPLDKKGCPDPQALAGLVRPETRLVSCIWVGNETGVVTPVEELYRETSRLGLPLHLDGAQAWGKLEWPSSLSSLLNNSPVWTCFSAHKIGALPGVGLVRRAGGAPLRSWIDGHQEGGFRGGTENTVGIVAAGAVAARLDPTAYDRGLRSLRDRLEAEVLERIPGVRINGQGAARVANTSSFSFAGLGGVDLVAMLDLEGFAVSAGSACASGTREPSHVLLAMGLSPELARSSIRVSLSEGQTWEELQKFVHALEAIVSKIRGRRTISEVSTQW